MSRRIIPGLKRNYEVVVGWDRPLGTFFGQVYDRSIKGEDAQLIHWVGAGEYAELPDVDDLEDAIEGFAKIGWKIAATLNQDRRQGK